MKKLKIFGKIKFFSTYAKSDPSFLIFFSKLFLHRGIILKKLNYCKLLKNL